MKHCKKIAAIAFLLSFIAALFHFVFAADVKPYFLLVPSTYENEWQRLSPAQIKVVNESPYHGLAVRLIWEFDDTPVRQEMLTKQAQLFALMTNKAIWPWIFLNRMIGNDENEMVHDASVALRKKPIEKNIWRLVKSKPYFRKIKGMDLYDQTGALTDFVNLWRLSLRLAKITRAPGVVFDMEAYNNYQTNHLAYLAGRHGKTREEIKGRLEAIGRQLMQIAEQEYPGLVVWFLITCLENPQEKVANKGEEFFSMSYVALGMIKEAEQRKMPAKFVSGCQAGVGYCYVSVADMIAKIKARDAIIGPLLKAHPSLVLGGTIAPWADSRARKGYMLEGACGQAKWQTIDDFLPLIQTLASHYAYVWIYATPMAGYDPFNREVAARFNSGLEKVIR